MRTSSTFVLALRATNLTIFGLLMGILFLIPALGLQAQPTIAWNKTIGGYGYDDLTSLQQTADGGYILGGFSDSGINGDKSEDSRGEDDYWVVKLDAAGNKTWDKTLGGTEADWLQSLQQTSDGGYILGGWSESNNNGDKSEGSKGGRDYWVVKLDAAGNKLWDRTIGGSLVDVLASLQQTSDGGYILGGYSSSPISGDKTEDSKGAGDYLHDYWVVKLDAAGNKLWDKTIGSSGDDQLTSLQQTSDGGYILGGFSISTISGDKTESSRGSYDYWVVKLDAAGNKLWDKTIGGRGAELLLSLQQTTDGGYILGGFSYSSSGEDKTEASKGEDDYWVVRLDAAGNKLWDRTLGGNSMDWLYSSLQQTSDGGYIIGGESVSDISGNKTENSKGSFDYWVVKLDAEGNQVWDKTIGGSGVEQLRSLQQTSDGGYILGGTSESDIGGNKSENSIGGSDYWVVKLNPEGMRITSFTLIDADTDQDLQTLNEGDVIDLSKLPTTHLNVRANVSPATVGSVVFHLDRLPRYIENHASYALFGNTDNDYKAGLLLPGHHQLKATPYAATYGMGMAGLPLTVNFKVEVWNGIQSFTLVNADTDQDVMELREGDVIDYGVLGTRNINIRANTFPATVGSVVFTLNGSLIRRENILPYALGGDNYPNVDDYLAYPLPPGNHTLRATSYSGRFGSGSIVAASSVSFRVANSATAAMAASAVDGTSSGFAANPNPFTDRLTLQLGSASEQVQVSLVDQLGRTVYQKEFAQPAGAVEIDVSEANLKGGMYFLRLTSATTGTKVLKLMKR